MWLYINNVKKTSNTNGVMKTVYLNILFLNDGLIKLKSEINESNQTRN